MAASPFEFETEETPSAIDVARSVTEPPADDSPFEFESTPKRKRTRSSGRPDLDDLYERYGNEYDVDPDLLLEQGRQESSFSPGVIAGKVDSSKGARGVAQFMPDTAREFGLRVDDRRDPDKSIAAQARMMKKLLERHGGNVEAALAGYNSGHNLRTDRALRNRQRIPETRGYVDRITAAHGQKPAEPAGETTSPFEFETNSKDNNDNNDLNISPVSAEPGRTDEFAPYEDTEELARRQAQPNIIDEVSNAALRANQLQRQEERRRQRQIAKARADEAARATIKTGPNTIEAPGGYLETEPGQPGTPRTYTSVPDINQILTRAREQQPASVGMGDVRKFERQEAQRRDPIRQQLIAERKQAQTSGVIDPQRPSDYFTPAAIERDVDERLKGEKHASVSYTDRAKSVIGSLAQGVAEIPAGILDAIAITAFNVDKKLPAFTGSTKGANSASELVTAEWAENLRSLAKEEFPTNEKLQDSFVYNTVPQGLGSLLGFASAGWISKSATLVPALLGAGVGMSAGYRDALQAGSSEDDAARSALLNGLVGTSEALPVSRMLNRLDKSTGGTLKHALVDMGKEGTEEALQEFFQSAAGNVIAKQIYDKERGYLEGVIDNASAGAVVGSIASLIFSGATGIKNRGKKLPKNEQEIVQAVTDDKLPSPSELAKNETEITPENVPEIVRAEEPDPGDTRFANLDAAQLQELIDARPKKGTSKEKRQAFADKQAAARVELARRGTEAPAPVEVKDAGIEAEPAEEVPSFQDFVENYPRGGVKFDTLTPNDDLFKERATEYAQKYGTRKGPKDSSAQVQSDVAGDKFSLQGTAGGTVDQLAHEAAPSPTNGLADPSDAQIKAGNYKKGHVLVAGLDLSIENPEGSQRGGVDPNGKKWSVKMKSHYGYIKRSESADGEHVDVFLRPGTPQDYSGPVFVVNQTKGNGHFDEHKVMLGWADEATAKAAYLENYDKGWDQIGSIARFDNPADFKKWVTEGDGTKPAEQKIADASKLPTAETQAESPATEKRPRAVPESVDDDAPKTKHEFSSTQVNLPDDLASQVQTIAGRIPKKDLSEDGVETKPHLTVKSGLHTNSVEDLRPILEGEAPFKVTVGKISTFPPSESSGGAEVLKLDIDSADLRRLNKKIADALPHTDTFEYSPHITVAYVKAGQAKKYVGKKHPLQGREITLNSIAFSSKDGEMIEIPLKGSAEGNKAQDRLRAIGKRFEAEVADLDKRAAAGRVNDYSARVQGLVDRLNAERESLLAAAPAELAEKLAKDFPVLSAPAGEEIDTKAIPKEKKRKSKPKKPGKRPEDRTLTQAVIAAGGIRMDGDKANRGEWKRLTSKEGGRIGLASKNGMTAERMAMHMAELGYRGDWVQVGRSVDGLVSFDVDGNAFLAAIADDMAGINVSHSTERDYEQEFRDEYGGDEALQAIDKLYENELGKVLVDKVASGQASEEEIQQFEQLAQQFGVPESGIDAIIDEGYRTQRADAEAARVQGAVEDEEDGRTQDAGEPQLTDSQLAEGFTLAADGTLIDPGGQPLFSRPQQLGFTQEGLLQQETQDPNRGRLTIRESEEIGGVLARLRDSPDKQIARIARVLIKAKTIAKDDVGRGAIDELTGTLEKYEYVRGVGLSVDEYFKQGALFGPQLTSVQGGMLAAFEKHANRSSDLQRLVFTYVRETSNFSKMTDEQLGFTKARPLFQRAGAWLRRRKADLISLRIRNASDASLLKEAAVHPASHRLKVNEAAHELFRRFYQQRQYEQSGKYKDYAFTGVFNDEVLVRDLLDRLKRLASDNPQQRNQAIALARSLKKAAGDEGTAILYTSPDSLPEEAFHRASYLAARVKKLNYRVDAQKLAASEQLQAMRPVLLSQGYNDNPGELVEEAAAKLIAGDSLGLSEQDRVKFLRAWARSYEEINGKTSIRRLLRYYNELLENAYAEGEVNRGEPADHAKHDQDIRALGLGQNRRGKRSHDATSNEGDSPGVSRSPGDGGSSGPVFSREPELDPRQRVFRALLNSKKPAESPRGSVGGYFPRESASHRAPKAQPVPQPAQTPPPNQPPPNQPPPSTFTDEELLAEVDRILEDPQAKSYLGRMQAYARKLPTEFQRMITSEFTPMRLGEEQLIGKQRLDLAAKAELLPGASGQAELDLLRFQTRVVAPIAKLAPEFNRYLLGRRIIDRLTHDPDRKKVADWTIPKAEQMLAALKKKVGDVNWKRLEKAATAFQQETDAALQLRVDAGLISQKVYDAIKASSDFYAPFKVMKYVTEQMTGGGKGSGRRIPHTEDLIDRIKGIEDEDFQLQNFLLTAAQQIYQTRILAEKNRFMVQDVAPLADADPDGEIIRRAQPTRYFQIEYKPAQEILGQLSYQQQPIEQSFIKVGRAIELAESAGLTVKRKALVSALGRATIGGMESGGQVHLKAFTSEVIAHELGHGADVAQRDSYGNRIYKSRNVFGTKRDILQRLSSEINTHRSFQKEMAKLVDFTALGGDDAYRASAKERFSEFISLYIHNPKKARELAPTWTDHFELNILPNPKVKQLVEGLANFFQKVDALPNILTPLKDLDNNNYLELAIRRAFPDRAPQLGVRFGDKPRPGYKIEEYLDAGVVKALEVREDFAKALEGLHRGEATLVSRAALLIAQPFKWGATTFNLAFQPVNLFLADLPRAALISKYGVRRPEDLVRFPADWIYSFFTSMAGNFGFRSDLYEEFMKSGAYNSTIQRELTPEAFKPAVGVEKANIGKRVLFSAARIGSALEETSKILGLMRGQRFEGLASLSPDEQAQRRREIASEVRRFSGSPDFWRKGIISTGQTLENMNLLFMFLNARIQGTAADLARLSGRAGGGKLATAAWSRLGLAVGIPALTLMLHNLDDEEREVEGPEGPWKTTNRESYKQVPDWERENYFMIPRNQYFVNDRGERVRDYWKLPKREIVKLFGNLIEAAVQFADGRNPEHLRKFAVTFENLSPINLSGTTPMERAESGVGSLNPILKTPAELIFNRDTFRHRKIVPDYIDKVPSKDLRPEEQYTRSTAESFVRIGKLLGVSPLLLEHGTRGFTAGLVTQFMPPKQQPGRSPLLSYPAIGPIARRFVRSESTAKESDNEILDEALKDQASKKVTRNREAYKLYQTWKKNPEGKDLKSFLEERNVDPAVGEQALSLKEDDDKNLSRDERAIKQLGVENGQRSDFLRKALDGKSEEQRQALLNEWREKGMASQEVLRQLRMSNEQLKNRQQQKARNDFLIKASKSGIKARNANTP